MGMELNQVSNSILGTWDKSDLGTNQAIREMFADMLKIIDPSTATHQIETALTHQPALQPPRMSHRSHPQSEPPHLHVQHQP